MSKKYGFVIRRLLLSNGNGSREIKLLEGLNVISGPTDTGKTYIFQCIRYLLGSNEAPKTIPENKEYLDAYLEIFSYTEEALITLRRTFATNKIHIYSCEYESINETTDYITVNTKGRTKLISSEMLDNMGFNSNIELKTHINEDKFRKVAFRDFLHFSLIDEKEVIKDKSILTTGQYTSSTVELNAFFYFLTGQYPSYLSYLSKLKKDNKKSKSKEIVQDKKNDDYLDELIMATKRELDSLNLIDTTFQVSYKEEMLFVTSDIVEQSDLLKESFEDIEKLKSKRLMNEELIKRFTLLKDHLQSDLRRLEFILEGGRILSNLGTENCPTCGKKLDDLHAEKHHNEKDAEDVNFEKLFTSYNSEKGKILLNLNDLNVTVNSIEADNANIQKQIYLEEKLYLDIKQKIETELKPTRESLQEKIQNEVDSRLIRVKVEYLTNQLNSLSSQKEYSHIALGQLKTPEETTLQVKELVDSSLEELTKLMNMYLMDMKFPELKQGINNVSFDFKDFDFIINGKARSVYGKGFRSIIYSVFVISLMVYCEKNNLPHAGFVLIDSPLTTYQEAHELNAEEKIPEELKERFINTFTKVKESQVIILENKFTMKLDDKSINFIEFTKDRHNGRYGFM